jgi:hypothetical protein
MDDTLLSRDSAVKRHVLAHDGASLPFVSMMRPTPGEEATLGARLDHAIKAAGYRGPTAAEAALMRRHPEIFKHRGFLSSYRTGRRGGMSARVDARHMKAIAELLHVSFEWLVVGSGPMRHGVRAETPFDEAVLTARDWGVRPDAFDRAWRRNQDRAAEMAQLDWLDAIRFEAHQLDREGVARPEVVQRRAKLSVVPPPPRSSSGDIRK